MVSLLRTLTFLGRQEIEALAATVTEQAGARAAQRALAAEMTRLVHGQEALEAAIKASEVLFGGPLDGITEPIFQEIVGEVPTSPIDRDRIAAGALLTELFVQAGLCPSKGQARKDLESGGLYLNNVRVGEVGRMARSEDLLFGKHLLLRKGKRSYAVVSAG